MENLKVSGVLCEKISKKSNNPYYALDILLTPTYSKTFFLEPADVEVVKTWLEIERLKNERLQTN